MTTPAPGRPERREFGTQGEPDECGVMPITCQWWVPEKDYLSLEAKLAAAEKDEDTALSQRDIVEDHLGSINELFGKEWTNMWEFHDLVQLVDETLQAHKSELAAKQRKGDKLAEDAQRALDNSKIARIGLHNASISLVELDKNRPYRFQGDVDRGLVALSQIVWHEGIAAALAAWREKE